MVPLALAVVIAVVPVLAWTVAYVALLVATRPHGVTAAPAGQDLGPEPPAIANLLVNRWRLNADAAEATLLDLAARRFLELRQAGDDPVATTVHLRQQDARGLLPYEWQVLQRVQQLAVGGVVPVTALAFRDHGKAAAWDRRLRKDIIADARHRGLSRRRLSTGQISAFSTAAALAAAGPGAGWFLGGGPVIHAIVLGVAAFSLLAAWVGRTGGERDTPAGQVAAARWLGLRDWLRGHEEFATLPPASVTVWDRYLAYGAAVGTTRTTSAVLDLGMGDDRQVWSTYGGRWRRVRVRYPRFRPHYGTGVPGVLLMVVILLISAGLFSAIAGYASSLYFGLEVPGELPEALRHIRWGLAGALAPLVGYALYALVLGLVDLARQREITGEVLWLKLARKRDSDGRSEPWVHHLAVDDGARDTTTAWGLPSEAAGRIHAGDIARIRVRPWTRRVAGFQVLRPGTRRPGGARQAAEV